MTSDLIDGHNPYLVKGVVSKRKIHRIRTWGGAPSSNPRSFRLDTTPSPHEISRCEDLFTPNQVLHLFGASLRDQQRITAILPDAETAAPRRPARRRRARQLAETGSGLQMALPAPFASVPYPGCWTSLNEHQRAALGQFGMKRSTACLRYINNGKFGIIKYMYSMFEIHKW